MIESQIPQDHIKRGLLHTKSLYEYGQGVAADMDLAAPNVTYMDGSLTTLELHYGPCAEYGHFPDLRAKLANGALRIVGSAPTINHEAFVLSRSADRPVETSLRIDHRFREGLFRPYPYDAFAYERLLIDPRTDESVVVGNRVISLSDTGIGERLDQQRTAELIDGLLQLKPEDLYLSPDLEISPEFNAAQLRRALENITLIFESQGVDIRKVNKHQRVDFYVGDDQKVSVEYGPYILENATTGQPVLSPAAYMTSGVEDGLGNVINLSYMVKLSDIGFRQGVSATADVYDARTHKYLGMSTVDSPEELLYLGDVLAVLGQNAAAGGMLSNAVESPIQEAESILLPRITMPEGVDLKTFIRTVHNRHS